MKRKKKKPAFILKLDLAQRIHCLRLAAQFTQIELAQMIEATQGTISKLESGILEPTLFQLFKLRQIFGVSIDSIIDDKIDYISIAHNHENYDFDYETICSKLGVEPFVPTT